MRKCNPLDVFLAVLTVAYFLLVGMVVGGTIYEDMHPQATTVTLTVGGR